MASTVMGRVDSSSTSSGFSAGEIRLISVAPSRTCGDLGTGGRVDLEDDVGGQRFRGGPDTCTGLDECLVGEARRDTRTGLHQLPRNRA